MPFLAEDKVYVQELRGAGGMGELELKASFGNVKTDDVVRIRGEALRVV